MGLAISRSNYNSFTDVSRTILTIPCRLRTRVDVNPNVCQRGLIYRGQTLALQNTKTSTAALVFKSNNGLPRPSKQPARAFHDCATFFDNNDMAIRSLAVTGSTNPNDTIKRTVTTCISTRGTIFHQMELLNGRSALFYTPLPRTRQRGSNFLNPHGFTPHHPSTRCCRDYRVTKSVSFVFNKTSTLFRRYVLHAMSGRLPRDCVATPSNDTGKLNFIF